MGAGRGCDGEKGTTAKKTAAKKTAGKKTAGKKKAAKRELIDTGNDKRFVRRGAAGSSRNLTTSASPARRTPEKGEDEGESGQGDKGDR